VPSRSPAPKPPGRVKRWLDRVVLGMLMSIAIAIAERRLRKLLGGASADRDDPPKRMVEIR